MSPWLLLSLALLAPGCSGGSVASRLIDSPRLDAGRCSIARGRERPLIVEWPSADRAALEAEVRRGLVAVRYSGCSMRILPRCHAAGAYRYSGVNRKADRLSIKDADQLYVNLPLGATELEGKLAANGELTVDMTIVGQLEADRATVSRAELSGFPAECAIATHVVRAVTVGAFDFYAGADAGIGASVGPFLRARDTSKRETLAQDGSAAACAYASSADTQPPPQCGAFLRLEVIPIEAGAPMAASCPPGSRWEGGACTFTADVRCPQGTKLVGGTCVYDGSVACPAGLHFEPGKGCIPNMVAPPSPGGTCPAGMALLPGGAFNAGSDDGQYEREAPAHGAMVSAFCLDLTEVTVGAYAECARQGRCTPAATSIELRNVLPAYRAWADPLCNGDRKDRQSHPANCVDHRQAEAFCAARGARLPTEQEWEFAARGGAEQRVYPWGNDPADATRLNACGRECAEETRRRGEYPTWLYDADDGWLSTAPVGSYPRGAGKWGNLDLAGNVMEWTASPGCRYHKYACQTTERVTKGGGFRQSHFAEVRNSYRGPTEAGTRLPHIGFRCAKTP